MGPQHSGYRLNIDGEQLVFTIYSHDGVQYSIVVSGT